MGYAICFLTLLFLKAYAANEKTINEQDADEYLEKFGYLGKSGSGRQRSLAKTRAVKDFQHFAHLPETGRLDEPTKKAMLAPRCGMVDKQKKTRAGSVSKWEKDVLTWALVKPTSQIDSGRVRWAITQAFAVWNKVIPLNFTEVQAQAGADIQLGFHQGDHGDGSGNKFEGAGGVLAHAFFPSSGVLHFDDGEQWAFEDAAKIRQGGHIDLLSVTIHELGHTLGLPHSDKEEAIMYPWYRAPVVEANGNLKQFQLSRIDIEDIQNIYGPREGATARPPEPIPPNPTSTGAACPLFDAAIAGFDGASYFFPRGSDIGWTKANGVNAPANSATKFYISRRFPGAPSNGITAAVTDRDRNETFLFQGRRVFGYLWKPYTRTFTLKEGFPQDLQNDVSFVPEGAFQVSTGQVILFGGDEFVLWDSSSNYADSKGSVQRQFPGLPSNAKASVPIDEKKLYFLYPASYTLYDFASFSVISTQPLKSLVTC